MSNFNVTIESFPVAEILPVGADVRFQAHIDQPDNVPQGTVFQWYCQNDLSHKPNAPAIVYGPRTLAWTDAEWGFPGTHTIVLAIRVPGQAVRRIVKHQVVGYARTIAENEFNASANDQDPTPIEQLHNTETYLDTLKKIAAAKPPSNETQQKQYDDRVSFLKSYIHHLSEHLSGLQTCESYAIDALHVNQNTGERTQLRLWLVNVTEQSRSLDDWNHYDDSLQFWRLID